MYKENGQNGGLFYPEKVCLFLTCVKGGAVLSYDACYRLSSIITRTVRQK